MWPQLHAALYICSFMSEQLSQRYLEPVVQQMLLVLTDDKLTELHRLKCIELALGEQGPKVDQQGRRLTRWSRRTLELLDCFTCSQSALQDILSQSEQLCCKLQDRSSDHAHRW